MRLVKSWIEAMNSQAVADAMVCSKSLASRKRCPGATFRSGVRMVMLEAFEGFDICRFQSLRLSPGMMSRSA